MLVMASLSYIHDGRSSCLNEGVSVAFDERFTYVLSRFLLRKFVQDVCLANSYETIQKIKPQFSPLLSEKNMSRRLPLSEKREWFSPRDIEEIYGLSRKSLELIRKDAEEKCIPLEVSEMRFKNGSKTDRRRPFIRISRKSLEAYLEAHFTH